MARTNWFLGKSQEWLEAEVAKAQADLASGKTLVSWGQGGDSASKQVQDSAKERLKELFYALSILNPGVYDVEQFIGNNVTSLNFSGVCEGGS